MSYYYITQGDVRGRCPHNHRTISGAVRCLERDQVRCRQQGGYSDRNIYRMPDGARIVGDADEGYMTVDEAAEIEEAEWEYRRRRFGGF